MGGTVRRLRRRQAREAAYRVPQTMGAVLKRLTDLESRVARLEADRPPAALVATPGGLFVPRESVGRPGQ